MDYLLVLREIVSRGLGATAGFGSLWFISWAIRRKGEFDYPLDFAGQVVRWVLVVVLLGAFQYFPGGSAPRGISLVCGLAFLAWPNFAYHLTRLLRFCKLLPKAPEPAPVRPLRPQAAGIFSRLRRREPSIFELTKGGGPGRR
jgi:hypothetical protein